MTFAAALLPRDGPVFAPDAAMLQGKPVKKQTLTRPFFSRCVPLLVAASCVLRIAPALAADGPSVQCPTPGPADTEAAKTAFRDGQTAFSEGEYGRAVQLWSGAYERDCTAHGLLLNLATAEELLGRPAAAIEALELFNARSPDSTYSIANRKRIESLQRQLRERVQTLRPAAPLRRRPVVAPLVPVSRRDGDEIGAGTAALALTASGGAAALVGAVLYIEGRTSAAAASERCGPTRSSCGDMRAVIDGERARARAEIAGWMTGGGLAVLAGGIVWYLASSASAPAPTPKPLGWSASMGPDGAELRLQGAF